METKLEELRDKVAELEEEIAILEENGEDVTEKCEATLLKEEGTIRLALMHAGKVIIRSGAGEPLSLTSYAEDHGYRLELARKALRGSYFMVFKKED